MLKRFSFMQIECLEAPFVFIPFCSFTFIWNHGYVVSEKHAYFKKSIAVFLLSCVILKLERIQRSAAGGWLSN
jgi:hypothetical protein